MEHAPPASVHVQSVRPKWLALGALVVLLGLIIRTAWVTEDAYITLRSIDNWVNGLGLRWNASERVQAYTHPLWMLALSAIYFVTREGYATLLGLGVLTTLAALLVLLRAARTAGHAVAALVLLMLSRSFIEFSTSGLENPLTHLLVGVFVWLYAVRHAGLRALTLTAALLALNRSDALIVVLPALLHATWLSYRSHGAKQTALDLLIGVSPYLAWELYSLFYYGFLFPNTAYAKLNTGLDRGELARQGFIYLFNCLAWDPPTLIVMALGVVVALAQRRERDQLLAFGCALYVLYVIRIGGDFMLGRFLTLPLFLAACLLAISALPLEEPTRAGALVLPFLLLFWHPNATEKYLQIGDYRFSGVADERMYYRDASALMTFTRTHGLPSHTFVLEGQLARASGERLKVTENVGMIGYFAGPALHIVDPLALTDALLARLPTRYDPNWRVGHYRRHLPEGYTETITSGVCVMPDRNLCEYYAKLKIIISDELWSWTRFKTIAAMNFGMYDYLIDRDRYRYPLLAQARLEELSAPIPELAPWNVPEARIFSQDGIAIAIGRVSHAKHIALSLDGNDTYEIEFHNGPSHLGTAVAASLNVGQLHTRRIPTPPEAAAEGFDKLLIRPVHGDTAYSVGYIRLAP